MTTTPEQLREWASNLTDWEVYDIVKPGNNEHHPDAIEAAKVEFDLRHLSWEALSKRDEDTKRKAYGDDAYLKKCVNCGKATPYEVPRLLPIVGNKRVWFCAHCGVFLGGDPSKSLLAGFCEAIGGLASCALAVVLGMYKHIDSSAQGILMFAGVGAICDALCRIANAVKGMSSKSVASSKKGGT